MSWIQELYDTYNANENHIGDTQDPVPLLPVCHTIQNAHIQVVIDGDGNFSRATTIYHSDAATIIPCTEKSAGRTGSRPTCHPLCDSLQFISGDFLKYGGIVTSGYSQSPSQPHNSFIKILDDWCNSKYSHLKAKKVLEYLRKNRLVEDLVEKKILHLDAQNKLINITKAQLKEFYGADDKIPKIFEVIQPDQTSKRIDEGSAFIRWSVEIPGEPLAELHKDPSLWESWANYYAESEAKSDLKGICYVSGRKHALLFNTLKDYGEEMMAQN